MKVRSAGVMVVGILLSFSVVGCSHLRGKPGFLPETLRPDQTLGFAILYKNNCSACHGDNGLNGAALPLNNPVYLAWAGRDRMLQIAANGMPHTLMPAFSQGSGGMLTDRQVANIVDGMMVHWGKPGILNGANAPGYKQPMKGDTAVGQAAFQTHCAQCHGADGKGVSAGGSNVANAAVGSIVDPTYLALISSQGLRDIVVSGLPDEEMPDWRGHATGMPMTNKEVADIVAWLGSRRVQFPGQPFSALPQAGDKNPERNK